MKGEKSKREEEELARRSQGHGRDETQLKFECLLQLFFKMNSIALLLSRPAREL